MSVIAQSFDSGFDLKPMRRRSVNAPPSLSPAVYFNSPPTAASLPGADYFLSTRIANGSNHQNVQIEKPAFDVDSEIKVRRRVSAPPAMAQVYPAMTTQTPQVTIRRVADGPQERPEYQSEFPELARSEKENLKRRASYPPALKSCFQRRQSNKDENRQKSVQFFGFVQVQYTHSPTDYDRTAIACIANGGLSESSRQEQLEELRRWQQEMNEKMPDAPANIESSLASNTPATTVTSPFLSTEEFPTIAETIPSSLPVYASARSPKTNSELKPISQNKPQKSQRRNRNRSKASRAN